MAADTLSLRERIAQPWRDAGWADEMSTVTLYELADAILPLVEQEIQQAREQKGWTCFHCDETFTDVYEAREHFGADEYKTPACRLGSVDVAALRALEAANADLRRENERLDNDARLWYESEADRVRRIGNVQWWQEMDSREGERLVLIARAEKAEQALTAEALAEKLPDDYDTRLVMQLQVKLGQAVRARHEAESALAEKDAQLNDAWHRVAGILVDIDTASTEYQRRLAEKQSLIDSLTINRDTRLAEKDAQIAALRSLLNYALNGWGAHAKKDMEHREIGRLRDEARETPPPQEPPR